MFLDLPNDQMAEWVSIAYIGNSHIIRRHAEVLECQNFLFNSLQNYSEQKSLCLSHSPATYHL